MTGSKKTLPREEDPGAKPSLHASLTLVPGSEKPYEPDEMDEKILQLLAEDGRAAFLTVASELGVDEKTIRYRVAKMRSAGVLMFQASLNPNQLKHCVVLCLGIKLSAEAKKDAEREAEALANLPQVIWCGTTLGTYDLLAEVVLESFEHVREFQQRTLKGIPAIESAEPFVVLSHHGRRGIPITPKSGQ